MKLTISISKLTFSITILAMNWRLKTENIERHRLVPKAAGSCSSHLLNPARDRNMQIRRDPYSLESTRLDSRNRGFTRVARGEQPISERLGINKYGVKWKVIAFVD